MYFLELWAKRDWNSYSFYSFLPCLATDVNVLCSVGTVAGRRHIPGSVISLVPYNTVPSLCPFSSWCYQLACATSPWIVCHPLSVVFHCPHLCNRPLIKLSSVKPLEAAICHSWKPVRRIFDIYFLKSLILMPWFLTCVSLPSLTAAKKKKKRTYFPVYSDIIKYIFLKES